MTAAPALRPTTRPRRTRSARRAASTVIGIAILVVMLFPAYWMVNVSLQPASNGVAPPVFPFAPDFSAYGQAISQQGASLLTSLVVALGTVVLSLLIAAPAAHALAHLRFRWVRTALFIVLITQMIPGIVIANAVYTAYSHLGLLNTVPGLILADTSLAVPFEVLLLRTFMTNIPGSILEAARVDGAGPARLFRSIVLPLSRNGLITAGLFAFLFAWGDFFFALTLTSTAAVRPVTLGIYLYLGAYGVQWNAIMATGVMASLPAVVLLVVAQRYVATGALGGSLK